MRAHLRTFYVLLITQALSLIGSRMTSIAVGIWVFTQTGKTTPLLLTAFFNELPGMLGSSLAGVLVDRWNRRAILMLADAGQALGTLLLLLSFLSGRFEIWHLYAIVLLQGIFATFQEPAKNAAITMLVPEGQRERANGLQEMIFPLAGVLAPVITGSLYLLIQITGVILIDLATFIVAVIVVSLVRIPHPKSTAEGLAAGEGNFWQEMAGGLRFLRARPALWKLVLYTTFINFLLNGPLELNIPYLISITGSEAKTGAMLGIASLGAFAGAGLIALWGGTRPRIHTILPGMMLCGAMIVVYGTTRQPVVLALAFFTLMMPLPAGQALYFSILQVKTPPDMQGRVFALVYQLSLLASTTSFLLVGSLVDRWLEPAVGSPAWRTLAPLVGDQPGAGMGLLLVVTGLLILGATLVIYLQPGTRSLEKVMPDYEALEHESQERI